MQNLTLITVCIGAIATCATADVMHVNRAAPLGGDGTSWDSAFDQLQSALATAQSGDEIWVAAGTYHPAPPDGDPALSFAIPSGVALYGGFAGDETQRGQRDPAVNVTILSGDLNDDDTQVFTLPNSFHIVTMNGTDAATRLDGFELTLGYSFFAPSSDRNGAGVFMTGGAATVAQCTFDSCLAERGGGIHATSVDLTIEECRFLGNWASAWAAGGGAIEVFGSSMATIRDCEFSGNVSEARGGWSFGGAISSEDATTVTIERCSFDWNEALHRSGGGLDWCRGGAIFCRGITTISHCSFSNNVSNVGGAVQSWSLLDTQIINSTFRNNDAIGLFVSGQERDGAAGGIAGGGELDLVGCVVTGGNSDNYGGAWVGDGGFISGCVFWGNTDSAGNIGRSNIRAGDDVEYSCVENMLIGEPGEDPPDPEKFPGSIDENPQFVNAGAGDFRLTSNSPCIDAADNTAWPAFVTTDLDGNARFFDDPDTIDTGNGVAPIVDMGAYEFGSSTICAPDLDGSGDVGFGDLLALLSAWGPCADCAADLDGSGDVGFGDLLVLLSTWGPCS